MQGRLHGFSRGCRQNISGNQNKVRFLLPDGTKQAFIIPSILLIVQIRNNGQADSSVYTVLLAHNPDYFPQYAGWGADLTVSGHVHGGVARVPLWGRGVISPGMLPLTPPSPRSPESRRHDPCRFRRN